MLFLKNIIKKYVSLNSKSDSVLVSCFLATNHQFLLEMNKTETKTKFNAVNTVADYFQILHFARFWITKPNSKVQRTTEEYAPLLQI